MNLIEKLLFLIGIGIILFAFIMVVGALGIMLDDAGEWSAAESLGWMTTLGILPGVGGVFLCRGMRRRGRTRRHEVHERTILRLAKENGGHLTIADASMDMDVPSGEAKKILDQPHLNGLADIEVSDSGVVLYRFKMV